MKAGSELEGKKVYVVFQDGKEHYANKNGICTSFSDAIIILDNVDVIPMSRVIRIEVKNSGDEK